MRWMSVWLLMIVLMPILAVLEASAAETAIVSVMLEWTAPGDDGSVGTASTYEMRYRTVAPDTTSQATIQTWWNAATPVTGLPAPQLAGTLQNVTVGGLQDGIRYWFVMRAGDEVPNWSLFSNVATKLVPDITAPARIADLRIGAGS